MLVHVSEVSMDSIYTLSKEQLEEITRILRKGGTVELKKINGQLHIIEIHRKLIDKKELTTG